MFLNNKNLPCLFSMDVSSLSRKKLQTLARKYGLCANAKSNSIIEYFALPPKKRFGALERLGLSMHKSVIADEL